MPEVSWAELHWNNDIGAVLLTVGLISWVLEAEMAQNPADKPLQPGFLVGSHVGVILPLSGSYSLLALRPLDFCLNGKDSCCTCISERSAGRGRARQDREREAAPLREAPPS